MKRAKKGQPIAPETLFNKHQFVQLLFITLRRVDRQTLGIDISLLLG